MSNQYGQLITETLQKEMSDQYGQLITETLQKEMSNQFVQLITETLRKDNLIDTKVKSYTLEVLYIRTEVNLIQL